MKGPGLRSRLDARRHWRCPETGKTMHTPGHVTQLLSPFTSRRIFMEIVEKHSPARVSLSLEEILGHMQIMPEPREAVPPATPVEPMENPAADGNDTSLNENS